MRLSTTTNINQMRRGDPLFYSTEQSIELCYQAGFRVMDIDFAGACRKGQPMAADSWKAWLKLIGTVRDRLSIDIPQAHAHFYSPAGLSESERLWNEELVRRCIEASGLLGVKWLVMHPMPISDGHAYSQSRAIELNLRYFSSHLKTARQNQVGIAVENLIDTGGNRRFCTYAEGLGELISRMNDPNLGACWDFGHANIANIDQPGAIRTLGKTLRALHVSDNNGRYDEHAAPYFGSIDWNPILNTLSSIGYTGDFTLEVFNFTRNIPDVFRVTLLKNLYNIGFWMINKSADTQIP